MRLFQSLLIGGALLPCIALAQTPAPDAASPTAAPKSIPVAEYDSGIMIPMFEPWKRPGKEGTQWAVNGVVDQGEIVIRFPFGLEPTPTSLDDLYERELKALQKDKSWKKDKRSLTDALPALVAPEAFKARQLSVALKSGSERHVFLQTSEGKFVAIKCALPNAALSSEDPCAKSISGISMIPDAQLLPARDRARATNLETPCSIVSGEIDRYKAANPSKPLKEMYRFTFANGLFISMAMGGKSSSMQNVIALQRAFPDIVASTEKICLEQPEFQFQKALGEAIKLVPKPEK